MPWTRQHRFAFTWDGKPTDGRGEMAVTYLGSIPKARAYEDALRRFHVWSQLPNSLARMRSARQVVVLN